MVCSIITFLIIYFFSVTCLSACKSLPIYFSSSLYLLLATTSLVPCSKYFPLPSITWYQSLMGWQWITQNVSYECCVCKCIQTPYCSACKTSASPPSSQCPAVKSIKWNQNANVAVFASALCSGQQSWGLAEKSGWVWIKLWAVISTYGYWWTSYLCYSRAFLEEFLWKKKSLAQWLRSEVQCLVPIKCTEVWGAQQ